jgi:hypothetical protein
VFAFFNLGAQEIIILLILAVLGLGGVGVVVAVLFATGALGKKRNTPEE